MPRSTVVQHMTLEYTRSEEHTSELQSQSNLVCRLLLEKKNSSSHRVAHGSDGDTRTSARLLRTRSRCIRSDRPSRIALQRFTWTSRCCAHLRTPPGARD